MPSAVNIRNIPQTPLLAAPSVKPASVTSMFAPSPNEGAGVGVNLGRRVGVNEGIAEWVSDAVGDNVCVGVDVLAAVAVAVAAGLDVAVGGGKVGVRAGGGRVFVAVGSGVKVADGVAVGIELSVFTATAVIQQLSEPWGVAIVTCIQTEILVPAAYA
jgi:hypothetical protein